MSRSRQIPAIHRKFPEEALVSLASPTGSYGVGGTVGNLLREASTLM